LLVQKRENEKYTTNANEPTIERNKNKIKRTKRTKRKKKEKIRNRKRNEM
jgi:hypothetical protein